MFGTGWIIDRLWQQAVSAGARVVMPLGGQFWGERYGQLVDPFGHRWSLSMQVKMSQQEIEEKRRTAMRMFAEGEHPGKPSQSST
jgi:PhnB protein